MVLKENEQDFLVALEGQEILRISGNWYNILKEALERRNITIQPAKPDARPMTNLYYGTEVGG